MTTRGGGALHACPGHLVSSKPKTEQGKRWSVILPDSHRSHESNTQPLPPSACPPAASERGEWRRAGNSDSDMLISSSPIAYLSISSRLLSHPIYSFTHFLPPIHLAYLNYLANHLSIRISVRPPPVHIPHIYPSVIFNLPLSSHQSIFHQIPCTDQFIFHCPLPICLSIHYPSIHFPS